LTIFDLNIRVIGGSSNSGAEVVEKGHPAKYEGAKTETYPVGILCH